MRQLRGHRRRLPAGLLVIGLVVATAGLVSPNPAAGDGNEAPNAPEVFRAVSNGLGHTCAILDNGDVKCWGWDGHGQLGDGGTNTDLGAPPADPIDLGDGHTATAISAGRSHTCALLDDGTVKCWGADDDGQLGDGGIDTDLDAPPADPIDLGDGRTATAISVGEFHSCALLDNGDVTCWGWDGHGQLGDGDTITDLGAPPADPVDLGDGHTATAITTGDLHTCALLDDATVTCWGGDPVGQLGDGGTDTDLGAPPVDPVDLGDGHTATAIAAGGVHTCALLDDATVKCWGGDSAGQLGDGGTATALGGPPVDPVDLGDGHTATAITAGDLYTCAVLDDATVKC